MSKEERIEEVIEVIIPQEEVESKLDWKKAAKKLKVLVEDCSIDNYFKKHIIEEVRDRYNDKERTQDLYDAIMSM